MPETKEHHHGHDGNGISVRYGLEKSPLGRTVRAASAGPRIFAKRLLAALFSKRQTDEKAGDCTGTWNVSCVGSGK
jgi:hypothetical protein